MEGIKAPRRRNSTAAFFLRRKMKVKLVSSFAAAIADSKKSILKASKNTVNIVAAIARKNAIKNIQDNFTLRNNFTVNSVRFTQCPPGAARLQDIKSQVGITERAGYMERQEKGGAKTAGSKNLVIPTTKARGGSNASPVRKKFNYASISANMVKGGTGKFKSHKARFVARAFVAAKTGKFVRLNDEILRVTNFRKVKGPPSHARFKLTAILNLRHKSTITPKKEWLQPAATAAASEMQSIYNSEMAKL